MVLFYFGLTVAGINSFVIYSANNPDISIRRREFLKALSFQLVEDQLRRRCSQNMSNTMESRINEILGLEAHSRTQVSQRGRCAFCDRKKK